MDKDQEEYENLKKSKFKQQKLSAWRPVPTKLCASIIFFAFGVIFIIIGIIILVYTNKIEEISYRYDDKCNKGDSNCKITLKIQNNMDRNIMVYYKLNGFYQNHRRYINSKSDSQLKGEFIDYEAMKASGDCDPVITNKDMGKTNSVNNNNPLNEDDVAIPCGLMAKSFFNDNFKKWELKTNLGSEEIHVNENDIAWRAEYKNIDLDKQWIDMTNEHFIVWIKPSGLPDFKKLWGRITDRDLKAGNEIEVTIDNKYDVSSFNGEKYLILSTTNSLGGKNTFLSISYIVIGAISVILCAIFNVTHYFFLKKKEE